MADRLGQVTIPSGGKVQINTGLPTTVNPNQYMQVIQLQNNGSNNMRFGDSSVSSTRGIILQPSGSDTLSPVMVANSMISDWWVWGTEGDILDYLYISGA